MCGVLGWMNVIVGLNESKVQKYLQIDISLHLAVALCEMLPTLTLQNISWPPSRHLETFYDRHFCLFADL